MLHSTKSTNHSNSSIEYSSTQTFNNFMSKAKPIAEQIVKDQHLANTTFPDDERVMLALDDVFLKHHNATDWNLCMTQMKYLRTVLHNELYTVKSYDSGRIVKGKHAPDGNGVIPASSSRFVPYDNEEFARVADSDDSQEIINQDMQEMPSDENQADAPGCFEQACSTAFQYLSGEDRLILEKAPREFVLLSGSLRDDKAAFDKHFEEGVGKLVMRYMSDRDIASIIGMSEGSVRVKRNVLKHEFVKMLEAEFRKLYKESDCDRQFAYLLKRRVGKSYLPA